MRTGRRRPLLRFAVIGSIGFLIDAAVLTALVKGIGWGHYSARAVSFALAVTATWYGNRRWVFDATADKSSEYARYFSVQIFGALLNLGVYVSILETFPVFAAWPVIPLAIGAGIGLLSNFTLSRALVFSPRPGAIPTPAKAAADPRDECGGAYTGTDNLAAMEHARNYNRHLTDLLRRFASGNRVLDFGAGTGTFAKHIAADGLSVQCVEPDAMLRQRLAAAGLSCVAALPEIADRSVDFVYSLNVLEHIEDDLAVLRELHRCLKPRGRLLLYVPAFQLLYSAMDRKVGHFRRYRKGQLVDKLARAGFDVHVARYVDSIGFLVTLLYKAIGSRSGELDAFSVRLYDRWLFPASRRLDRLSGRVFGKNLLVVAQAETAL